MTISASASLFRFVLCCMLLASAGATGQTAEKPPQPPKKATAPAKPPPVVRPQGATHAQKPPQKPPAVHPAPVAPAVVPPPVEPPKQADTEPAKGSNTGLPLPRFAALRSDEVNLRAGPGTRYPIQWIYKRRELPVQIQREFEVWRLVQDPDGIKGWVHQATLTGRRSFIVAGSDATLRRSAEDSSTSIAILKPGVIGHVRSCAAGGEWCQVQTGDYRGYLRRSQMWGIMPGEVIGG